MTVKLDLDPALEATLTAQARARGLPLDAYLQSVIENLGHVEGKPRLSPSDLEETLNSLEEMGKNIPHLPSSALSRESIYRGHD